MPAAMTLSRIRAWRDATWWILPSPEPAACSLRGPRRWHFRYRSSDQRGVDPYVATRGANGWSTEYVGIPSNIDPASDPFSSTLAEASPVLETFAFAGQNCCAPCFGPGIETGIPLHLPNGELVQGMAGSIQPGLLSQAGRLHRKDFSANGAHFIFGSVSQFEPDANKKWRRFDL